MPSDTYGCFFTPFLNVFKTITKFIERLGNLKGKSNLGKRKHSNELPNTNINANTFDFPA